MAPRARRLVVALLWVMALADLVVLAIRITDVIAAGDVATMGIEGPGLYAMWRERHGYAIYEWPTRPFFALSLYNIAFYKVYAWILALVDVRDPATPMIARFITLGFAAVGAVAQFIILSRASLKLVGRRSGSIVLPLAFVTWFGAAYPGWWILSIRPDVAAAAFATVGLGLAIAFIGAGERRYLVLASLFFLIAWLFKQSAVALFTGCVLFVALRRSSFKDILALVAPFACGVAVTMFWGGEVYRFNIVYAPSLNGLAAWDAFYSYRGLFRPRLLLWAACLAAAAVLYRQPAPGRNSPEGLLFAACACGLGLGALLLAKAGSATNHVMELNAAAGMLCTLLLARTVSGAQSGRPAPALIGAAICIVPMLVYTSGLLYDDRGVLLPALTTHTQPEPRLLIGPREDVAPRRREGEAVSRLRPPVYIDDDIFAQPWFANGNQYPAVVIDLVFFDTARSKGIVGDGLEGLVRRRYFGTLVLQSDSYLRAAAAEAGYRIVGTLGEGGSHRPEVFRLE
jgi:hypothetical protein